MALPWLRLIDGVLGAGDIARFVKGQVTAAIAPPSSAGSLEAPLAGVVVGALREAFNRDHERLEIERQRMAEEHARAERSLRLELLRQVGEREIGRLRLLSGVAIASLLGSLVLVTRLVGGALPARAALGIGWLLLIAALAAAFSGQSHVASQLGRADGRTSADEIVASPGGALAPWLIVGGLAAVALGVLVGSGL